MGQIIYREYIVFRGSNIPSSLARVCAVESVARGQNAPPTDVKVRQKSGGAQV